jgi:hypothetical protein
MIAYLGIPYPSKPNSTAVRRKLLHFKCLSKICGSGFALNRLFDIPKKV